MTHSLVLRDFLKNPPVVTLFARVPAAVRKLAMQSRTERREVARRRFATEFLKRP